MTPSYEEMSEDQKLAVDTITQDPGPFFLTGPAGTGKSYVISYLRDQFPTCAVTATTGMAAQLIQGRTLHSFAMIIPRKGVIRSEKANQRMRNTDLLVVDEASMMNGLLLTELYERIRQAQAHPKVVLVGDLLQLPPVEGEMLCECDEWEQFTELRLKENHRQHEGEFIEVLHKIRRYVIDDQVQEFVKSRTVGDLPDDCTHLMSRKNAVQSRNLQKLRELRGKPRTYPWSVNVVQKDKADKIKYSNVRFPDELQVKSGARIVLLTNHPEGWWVNGSTGEVVDVLPEYVTVRLDNGQHYDVEPAKECIYDGDGNVMAEITQIPMLLAWALTIHKSQGMTLDKVGVDMRNHFAAGMTYVALSRCREAEGLFLTGNLGKLVPDPRIVKWAKKKRAQMEADPS